VTNSQRTGDPLVAPLTISDVLARGSVRSVYQPVVDLASGEVTAYEALARGPVGTVLERPDALFSAAAATGCTSQLDALCRRVALEGARDRLGDRLTLFVNVEPVAAGELPDDARTVVDPSGPIRVVAELTERNLTARPAELLRMVEAFRARGWGIALDDVGADPGSLALLPLLRPDVVKLDLRLVQERPSRAIAEIFSAVNAESERSGAAVVAEGIETDEHVAMARSLGATLGQGWHLGRPQALPTTLPPGPRARIPISAVAARERLGSPFGRVAAYRPVRAATKSLLTAISRHIETEALTLPAGAVMLTTFQEAGHLTDDVRQRYARLAQRHPFIGMLGAGFPREPAAGAYGADLAEDDPVRDEWNMALVTPHFAVALVGRQVGDGASEDDRRFDYVLTHDRDVVIEVAGDLMTRMSSSDER